jgi:hypothetical protein
LTSSRNTSLVSINERLAYIAYQLNVVCLQVFDEDWNGVGQPVRFGQQVSTGSWLIG